MTSAAGSLRVLETVAPGGELDLSIGGVGLSIEWPEPGLEGKLSRFFRPFLGQGADTIRLRVRLEEGPEFSGAECLFDAGEHWRLRQLDSRYVFEIFDAGSGPRHTVAFVSQDFSECDAYVAPASPPNSLPPWSLPRLMQPLGQLLLINRLSRLGGVMVHALGVDDGGRGSVFVGPSGSGKSTLGRFWHCRRGVRILSDECVILRRESGKLLAYGTPWSGLQLGVAPCPGPVQVERIFFICHASQHRLWEEPAGAFAGLVFSQLFLPFWNPEAVRSALELCQQLLLEARCQRLGFANKASIVDYLRDANKGGTG